MEIVKIFLAIKKQSNTNERIIPFFHQVKIISVLFSIYIFNPAFAAVPVVTSVNPIDNTVSVSIKHNPVISFTTSVRPGGGNVYLKKSSDNSISEQYAVGTDGVCFDSVINDFQSTIEDFTSVTNGTVTWTSSHSIQGIGALGVTSASGGCWVGRDNPIGWNWSSYDTLICWVRAEVSGLIGHLFVQSGSWTWTNGSDYNLTQNAWVRVVLDLHKAGITGSNILRFGFQNNAAGTFCVDRFALKRNSGTRSVTFLSNDLSPNTGYYINIDNCAIKDSINSSCFGGYYMPGTWNFFSTNNYSWDNSTNDLVQAGNGTWGTDNYWTLEGIGNTLIAWPGSGNDAVFEGSDGSYTININGTQTVDSLIYRNSGYSLNSGTINSTNGSVSVASGKTATLNSSLNGSVGLTFSGGGTLILTGNNTYTGPTTISSGDLRVNSSTPASSGVTVSSGAILSGTGNSNGSVTVDNGGIINPGSNSAGQFRTGALTLNGTSVLNYDIGTASDAIAVTGNLTLDGTINISAGVGFTYGTKTILTYTGTLINNGLTVGIVPGGYTASVSAGSGSVTLTIKANQAITFNALVAKAYGDADYSPGATASSGLSITYASSNASVATIVSGKIHIVGVGTTTITASQAGNANYNAAPNVDQTLTVNKANQTITFNALAAKAYGNTDYSPGATASSGLTVTYTSSNSAVATIVGNTTIHIVAPGTATITAMQTGNTNYNAAPNVHQTLTVNKANQTITFNALAAKTFGDNDYSPGATASSNLAVTYTSSNATVATIVSGKIHIVGAGTSTITASQSGDANYNAASSIDQTLTVNKANQTITFNVLPSKIYGDTDFLPGATATSGLAVTYTSSNASVATIVAGKIQVVAPGTAIITASQPGNGNYNAALSVDQTLTVNKANQIITFNALPGKTYGDTDFPPGAIASSNLAVTYTSSNLSVATIVDGNIHIVGAGTSTITASQAGDANFNAAVNVNKALTVTKKLQTITFGALAPKSYGDVNYDPGAIASSGLAVTYTSSNASVATIVAGQIHIVGTGTSTITASQAGDDNYLAAPNADQGLTVGKKTQTITFPELDPKTYGDADYVPGAVASSGLTITYSSSDESVATIIDEKIHIVGAGTTTITASQAGDDNFLAAPDVNQILTVGKKSQTIIFSALDPKIFGNPDYAPGAIASSGLPVTYSSSDASVATIIAGQIHIIGAGSTTITASQAGSDDHLAAPDVNQTLTVGKANQTITFEALGAKVYGDADYSPGATASSGLAVAYSSSNPSVATIIDGKIHIVGFGTSTITASQAGNVNYNVASNIDQTLTVNKKAQTIAFGALTSKAYGDVDYDPGAAASSGLPITYTSSNTSVAAIVDGQIHIVGAGTATITASQAGDDNYLAAPNVEQGLTVGKTAQTINFSVLDPKTYGDADYAPGAVASSELTVTYSSSDEAVATIDNGKIHIVGAGTTTITASQAGNENYLAAPDVNRTLDVGKKSQTITFASLDPKTYGDPDFAPGATVSSNLTVTYSSSNASVATIVTGQIHIVGAGTTTITASQAGDDNYLAAPDVNQILVVGKKSQTIAFSALDPQIYGDPDYAPGATTSSGLALNYTSSSLSVATIVDGQIHITGVGTTTITASQAGDDNYFAADNVAQTLTVNKANQTITFTGLDPKAYADPDYSPGATASSGLAVTYTSSDPSVATVVDGKIHIVELGTTTITASQAGDDNFNAAPSVDQVLTVGKADQTITFSLDPKTYGDPDFIPGATASSGLQVTYTSSNASVATIVGEQIHIVGAGTSTITAIQGGDVHYNAAPDVNQTLTVNKADQTITFSAIPLKASTDPEFDLEATASSGLVVTYTSSNTGVATVTGNTVHLIGVEGSSIITASQAGNDNFNPAPDVVRSCDVGRVSQTINFPDFSEKRYLDSDFNPGASSTSGLTITYVSSDLSIATIVDGKIHIVNPGTSNITASQGGNGTFFPAEDATKTLTVGKATQTIAFAALDPKAFGDPDYAPGATTSSGLTVTYSSSNASVATIVDGKIHIVGGGSTTITASQTGNEYYLAAPNVDQLLTVGKIAQTINFAALDPRTYGDADYAPGATASSGLTVTYASSDPSIVTIVDGKIHIAGGGTTTITASQAGDDNYLAADPVDRLLTVNKASQTITFAALDPKTYKDVDYAPGATVSSNLSVSYSSSNLSVATIVDGKIHIVGAGTTTITASQAGDNNYLAADPVDQLLTVNKASQTITFAALDPKTYGDVDYLPGATTSSGLTVTYSSSDPLVAMIVEGKIRITGGGTTTITASQTGDGNYFAAPNVGQVLTVGKKSQTIAFSELAPKIFGDPDFLPGATASSDLTVTYSSSNLSAATIVDGQIHIIGGGNTTITASQTGNENYLAAPDIEQVLIVGKKAQTINFAALDPKTFGDEDFAPGAVASSGLTITYTSSDPLVATIVDGKIHVVGGGSTTITASQAGDDNYLAAPSVDQTLSVGKKVQTITFAALDPKTYGDADYLPGATASSGLTVVYSSSDPSVATINDGKIHIVGAGTTTITASQAGDDNYIAAPDVNQTLTIEKKVQTITFSALDPKTYGDADYPPGATASSGLAVAYSSSNPSVAMIVDGKIRITGGGSTTITASQTGDGNYFAAPNVDQVLTVGKKAQTITFSELAPKTYGDLDYSPGASSSSGLTVTYSSSNLSVATIVDGKIHIVGGGSTTITASQTGNVNYQMAPNIDQILTVNKAPQNITFAALDPKTFGSENFAPGATASSGLVVTYTSSDPLVATIVDGTIHITGSGTATIIASQAGDENYLAADNVEQTLAVGKATQTINFSALDPKAYGDPDYSPGATASSGLAVTYTSSNASVATIVDGKIHVAGSGSSIITATQAGDDNYFSASADQMLTVGKKLQTITFSPFDPKTYGDADFDPAATASSGLTVEYKSSNLSVATIIAGQIHIVGGGTTTITALQAGDDNYLSAPDVNQTLTVARMAQTITFGALEPKKYLDADFSPGATASSGLTVEYSSSNLSIATIVDGNIHITGAGTTTITASQAGDNNYLPASMEQLLTVIKADQIISFSELDPKTYGNGDYEPGATASSGLTVTYSSSDLSIAKIVDGKIHIMGAGTTTITASQAGSDNYNAAPNADQTLTVVKSTQTITFAELNSKTYGEADFSPGATASSGLAVSYSSSNTSVATIVAGQIHIAGSGSTTITALQAGDDNYLAALSIDQLFTVGKADQTITFDSLEEKNFGDPDYAPGATVSSGLIVSYTSSNLSVATIIDEKIHIVGPGVTTIKASQAGNTNFNAAPDVNSQLTVGRLNQVITFAPLAEKYYGNSDYEPGATASSGLAITYSSSNSDVATIIDGKIHITGTGNAIITVSQAGNSDYRPAADVNQNLKVNKANQVITFAAIASKIYGDTDFTLGATASSGLPVFYASSDTGIASIVEGKIHIRGGGTTIITASQAGDTNYNAAADVSQTMTVDKADQTIAFGVLAGKVYSDTDFIPGATASSGLPVTYMSGDTNVATIVEGKIHITGAGTTIIKAFQTGNTNFSPADSVEQELIVSKADQIITFGVLPEKAIGDTDFSPGALTSSGLVIAYTSSNPAVATIVNGKIHITGAGTSTITASQSGDGNYNPAINAFQILATGKTHQTIAFDSIPAKTYGDSAFVPVISASSGLSVVLVSSDTTIAAIVNDTVVIRGAGMVTLTASQAGNETFIAAQEVSRALIMNKKELIFAANNQTRLYKEQNPIFTWTVSGFVNNDTISEIDTLPLISTSATIESTAGIYPISILGGSDNNYKFSCQNATLSIGKAQQNITFDSISDYKITDDSFVVVASASSGLGITLDCGDTSKIKVSNDTVFIRDTGCVTIIARQAGNNNYDSAHSVARRFCIETVPLEKPTLIVNASERENQPITPSLVWHKVNEAAAYRIQIALENQFTSIVYDSATNDTVKLIKTLAKNTEYFWRVRAQNRNRISDFSTPDSFMTIPDLPSVPTLIVDDSDRTNQKLVVSLIWHSVQNADNYRIQFSNSRTFSNTISDSLLNDTIWTTDSLKINTWYYWRVLAGNKGGNSAFSTPDSFMTIVQILEAPEILTVIPSEVRVGTSITIDWKEVTGALSYGAVISKDSLFAGVFKDTLVNDKHTLNITGLQNDQIYFCHIDARAGKNRSTWSKVLRFTTLINNDSTIQSSTSTIISGNVAITPEIRIVSDTLSAIRGQIITVVKESVAKNSLINVSHMMDFSKSPVTAFDKPVALVYIIPDLTIDNVLLDSATKKVVRPFFIDDSNKVVVIRGSMVDSSGAITVSMDTLKKIFFGIDTIKPVIIDNTSSHIVTNGTIPLISGKCYDNISNTKYMIYYRKGGNTKFDSIEMNASAANDFSKSLGEKAAIDSSGLEYYICANDGTNQIRLQNKNISTYIINKSANTAVPVMKWYLFAPPVSLVNDSISRLLSTTLGDYGKKWRMYRYDNQPKDTLIEFNNGLSRFEIGKAYWLKTRNEGFVFNIDTGITTPINQCYTIEVPPRKWLPISNPYLFPVSWESILDSSFVNESVAIGPYTYADSAWVTPNSIEKIEPWKGYYIYNNSDKAITLRIPSIRYSQSLSKKAVYQQVLDWVVRGNDEISCNNIFGTSNASSDNYDPLYDFPMPASPDNSIKAYFYRNGFTSVAQKFQTDFTNFKDGGAIWHIKIENLKKGESYFCHINEIEKLPDSLMVYTIDLTTGIKWDMRKNDYGIQGSASVNEIAVDLVIGTLAYVNKITNNYKQVPMQFTVSALYPNPVRHIARLNYTIPYDPHRLRVPVSFSVFTMSGRKVFTINEPARSAGYYTILIDVSSANRTVSSGTYVYKLNAGKNWKSQLMKVLR